MKNPAEMEEALEMAMRWKDEPTTSFAPCRVLGILSRALLDSRAALVMAEATLPEALTLDTDQRVCFYEQEFYVLSNFSSFRLRWASLDFDTSEHAYHWERFNGYANMHQEAILATRSAHQAFRYAQENKRHQRPHWDEIKVGVMRGILRAKAEQHEYVRRKLLETGKRLLVENSWRDPFWGWGPNRDGQNMLGKVWMQVRSEIQSTLSPLVMPTEKK